MNDDLFLFTSGVVVAGHAVVAAFFFRFWARTKDSLFLIFALAFLLFAANSALVGLLDAPLENRAWTYLLRLAGFSLLIVAILGKTFSKAD